MSGGYFNYNQSYIRDIADEVARVIAKNNSKEIDEWGYEEGTFYSGATIGEFKKGLRHLKLAAIYAQRIDWLLSGDDGEDTFHTRLANDIKACKDTNRK
jgi:hypothetical protein